MNDGAGFQPLVLFGARFLGRCPRLGWNGPLAHQPSGYFAANNAWALCAVITHNLLRAAATLASPRHARARGATIRRQLVIVPARFTLPHGRPMLHLPTHWPWASGWSSLHTTVFLGATPAARTT